MFSVVPFIVVVLKHSLYVVCKFACHKIGVLVSMPKFGICSNFPLSDLHEYCNVTFSSLGPILDPCMLYWLLGSYFSYLRAILAAWVLFWLPGCYFGSLGSTLDLWALSGSLDRILALWVLFWLPRSYFGSLGCILSLWVLFLAAWVLVWLPG